MVGDTKSIPERFLKSYNSFLKSAGYREPDHVEVAYDHVHNIVMEWCSLSVVKVSSVAKLYSHNLVNDIEIVPVLDDEHRYTHTIIRVFLTLDVPDIEKPELNTQIKIIRKWIKKLAPSVRVKKNRGTAYGWIGIWSSKEGCDFTDQEREALKKAGLSPGGNYTNISPERRQHWYTIALDQLSIIERK